MNIDKDRLNWLASPRAAFLLDTQPSKQELLKALKDLYAVLGPSLPTCLTCKGCQTDWQEALDILKPIIKKLND